MRYSERFMEHIEYAFNAFCKSVLHHEAVGAWRDLKRKEEREISLDYLMSEKYFEPSAMDSYFEKRDKPTVFLVLGKEVVVDSEPLAAALSRLPKLRRDMPYLFVKGWLPNTKINRTGTRSASNSANHVFFISFYLVQILYV